MTELLLMGLVVSGVGLWMVGGYRWTGWRRWVWPGVAMVGLCLAHVAPGRTALVASTLSAVNHLPYGERTPWPLKGMVCVALGGPALLLHLALWPWVLGSGLVLTGVLWGLQRVNGPHKVWEGLAGLLQAGLIGWGASAVRTP